MSASLTPAALARQRLVAQQLARPRFATPAQLVAHFGAVQAQDHAAAKWAVAQRVAGASGAGAVDDASIDAAFDRGELLRTHVLRPTWHLVTPADVRWLLALTAPRVIAASRSYYRKVGLDDAAFARSNAALAKALSGGRQLTRAEARAVLARAGLDVDDPLRCTFLVMRAELDGVVCSGAKRGKQHTLALLDDRAPRARPLARADAVAELARRYFTSHGPATLADFAWWSGLTLADARAGVETCGIGLERVEAGGVAHWRSPELGDAEARGAWLLPNYDELAVAYAGRDALGEVPSGARAFVLLGNIAVVDGRVAGTWKRTLRAREVVVEVTPFAPLSRGTRRAFAAAAERYGDHLGVPARLA